MAGTGVEALLEDAAFGRIGVDRRLIRAILAAPDAAEAVLRFSRSPRERHRLELDPLLVDLFRHFSIADPAALEGAAPLDFYLDAIRRSPEEVSDELVQALFPFGEKAVAPLLALYQELGEEQGSDVAFVLAGLRVRDPRVLELLLDRLEYDAADGAFLLGLYGDPAARGALEKMLAEIPEEDAELRREIQHSLEQLDTPEPQYEPEPFDILAEYPEYEPPVFDLLTERERLDLLRSEEPRTRAGAAHSLFNAELSPKARAALFESAQSDADPIVRAKSWEALADATAEAAVRDAMIAALNDPARSIDERGGAAVGLYGVADRDDVRQGIEALYEMGGQARAKALEAMWRSLWPPYAKYFPRHLEETDVRILREALRGAGYFRLTKEAGKIAEFFDREEPYDKLREDALFSYALAMPGETTRGRVKGMLRKIDSLAHLTPYETHLVEFALDERLRLHGLDPVFESEEEHDHDHERDEHAHHEHEHPHHAQPAAARAKVGRNDPCPCGSGKKYKKCCGK
ncbi:MAG TPA: SEC-C metal-binding domain-containing protein [Bryobacteraceae bacterium]|nr:SEC-C metal-binding domain-containing protein [Bryobacteraceae bacterium]